MPPDRTTKMYQAGNTNTGGALPAVAAGLALGPPGVADRDGGGGSRLAAGASSPPNSHSNSRHVSCENCRAKKIKCSRTAPCISCKMRGEECQWSGAAPSSSSAEDDSAGATHELLRLRKLCQLLEDQVVRRERAGPSLPPSSYMHPTPPPSMAYRPAPTPSSMARHVAAAERRALSEGDPRLVAPPPPRRISEAYPMTVATPFSSPSRHPASDPSRYHVADIDRPLPRSRSISEVAASRWRGPVVQTSSLRDS